jgi:phosphatidylserine decarboxylase precursor
MQDINSFDAFLGLVNEQLYWIPGESVRPKELLFRLTKIWFFLDQPSVIQYQSPIRPIIGTDIKEEPTDQLTPLSRWMVRFSNEVGKFMDTPASAAHLETFRSSPPYRIDDYIEPRGGWKTFNEFFCRRVKPGRRPIAAIGDQRIVTSPTDFEFKEAHHISAHSNVTTKGFTWPISQMLKGSPYRDRFQNGTWLHGFLNVNDYHRIHAPVGGRVLEARIIQGQNFMLVEAGSNNAAKCLYDTADETTEEDRMTLTIPNETGYQFCQSRGLIVLDTGAGLVAVLPVGMALVSSVILTAEVGAQLHKGEELGYFQFGGSDTVLIFDAQLDVQITMVRGQHYLMGSRIGQLNISSDA